MSKIKVMDELLANKIAAGEVIEKISSIVKELVENAIDAESKDIIINLLDSGLKMVEVIDDGNGMDKSDAKTAFLRHATSKIYKEDDLYFINTLGFRGEALASIAAVSEVNMDTFDGKEATHITIKGGKEVNVNACAERKGTDIKVTNLFYNTPARLKYLKSSASELSSCTSLVERLALSHPDISFCLTNNNTKVLKTTGSGNLHKVIYEIFGKEIASNALEFKGSSDNFDITGYACKPFILKSTKNNMITLLNGRIVRNNEINNAINDAYYTYKPEGKYPVVVLNIITDPTIVDVNIHPTKQDVKISESKELCSLITKCISDALNENSLILKPLETKEFTKISEKVFDNITYQVPKEMQIEYEKELLSKYEKPEEEKNVEVPKEEQYFMDFGLNTEESDIALKSLTLHPVGLALGTYIIAENEEGIFLLDQHAAYERINYERYMKKLKEKEISKVSMLIPITIELTSSEYAHLLEKKDILSSLNIDIEPFGINTIIVKSHPTWLKEGYEEESVRKIIDLILNLEKDFDRVKFEEKIAITLACKMSIKANHHISFEEMEYILDELVKCDQPYNCPHGRPTIIKFTIYELEKMFKRAID